MKNKTVALVGAFAFALSAAPAMAGPHADAPGEPGAANCVGQTVAFLAQGSKEQIDEPGLGNLAEASGFTVKQVLAVARDFCAAESGE